MKIASRDNTIYTNERERAAADTVTVAIHSICPSLREVREHQTRIMSLETTVKQKQYLIVTKDRQLQENQETSKDLDRHFGVSWRLEIDNFKKNNTINVMIDNMDRLLQEKLYAIATKDHTIEIQE